MRGHVIHEGAHQLCRAMGAPDVTVQIKEGASMVLGFQIFAWVKLSPSGRTGFRDAQTTFHRVVGRPGSESPGRRGLPDLYPAA